MSSKTIMLKPDDTVNIDGKTFTAKQLKEHVIDSVLYRKHLKELRASTTKG